MLREEGLSRFADPNLAIDAYRASPLYGRLRPGLTQAAVGPRRAALALRDVVGRTGFIGHGPTLRWNEVKDYLLKLTGRVPVRPRPLPPPGSVMWPPRDRPR